jgi:hypothetical protein
MNVHLGKQRNLANINVTPTQETISELVLKVGFGHNIHGQLLQLTKNFQ